MIVTILCSIPLLGHGEIRSSQPMPLGDPLGLGYDASVSWRNSSSISPSSGHSLSMKDLWFPRKARESLLTQLE